MKLTARQIAAGLREAARRLPENVRQAEAASGEDLLRACIAHSSGTHTAAALRALDHPYARRHGAPQLDPDEVNVEGGEFRQGWRLSGPEPIPGGTRTTVLNLDPKARFFVHGTTTMFARHPHEKAAREVAPRRRARLRKALRDAFRFR